MITIPVFDSKGKQVEDLRLDHRLFDGQVNKAAIHQTITTYLANQRQGNASTKTQGEVTGGGRKPWRQKGTGRARVGSIRSPLWRGGGVVFGPHPRSFFVELPKKIKYLALRSSLNARWKEEKITIIDDIKLEAPKTKEVAKIFKTLNIQERTLAVFDPQDKALLRASRNIAFLDIKRSSDINAYDIISHPHILFTKATFKEFLKQVKEK